MHRKIDWEIENKIKKLEKVFSFANPKIEMEKETAKEVIKKLSRKEGD